MPDQRRPHPRTNFLVEIQGLDAAGFSEVSGLSVEIEVIEYRAGDERSAKPRKIAGISRCPPIVLRRGITDSSALWEWHKSALEGRPDRRDGVITLLDAGREPVQRWRFRAGWPSRYEGPTLDARGNEVAIETLEIVHEGLELEA